MNRFLVLLLGVFSFAVFGHGTASAQGSDTRGLGCVNEIRDRGGNLAFQNNCDIQVHVLWYVNSHLYGGEWIGSGQTSSTYNQYSKISAADEPLSVYACPAGYSPVDAYGSYAGMKHTSSWHCHR